MLKLSCTSIAVMSFIWVFGGTAAARWPEPGAPQASARLTSPPTIVRIDGVLKTLAGTAGTDSVLMVVSLYADKEDSTPLWVERQLVTLDRAGRYTIFAGATRDDGVPKEFLVGAAPGRWLGVGVQGEAEQFRMMLVTVPYALKAGDADTLAGRTVTDFVLADQLTASVKSALTAQPASGVRAPGVAGTAPSTLSTTVNQIAKFIDTNNGLGDSIISEVSGNVGIGTTVPTAVLQLKAGTAAANTAPLKFTSGPLLTTAEAGAIEFSTDKFYGTITTGAARATFAFLENPTFTGVPAAPTAAGGTSTTQLATTAFVQAAVAAPARAALTLTGDAGVLTPQAILSVTAPNTNAYMAKFFRANPGPWPLGSYIGSQGEFVTNAWVLISGSAAFSLPSADPFMLGIKTDVNGPSVQIQSGNLPSYAISSLDGTGHYTFSLETDGTLQWGVGTRATMDTVLRRAAAGSLQTNGQLLVGSALGLGTDAFDGLVVQNTTLTTAAATRQNSPRVGWLAHVWNTAANETAYFFAENIPTSLATPTSLFRIGYSRNGAAPTYPLTLTNGGNLTALSQVSTLFLSIGQGTTGYLTIRNQGYLQGVADGKWKVVNNSGSGGVGLDFTTANAVLKIRTTDHTGDASLSALHYLASGYYEGTQIIAPAAGAVNTGRVYFEDSGGKTRMMVKFNTGAAIQLAIEP
jgi:hypothetical protein